MALEESWVWAGAAVGRNVAGGQHRHRKEGALWGRIIVRERWKEGASKGKQRCALVDGPSGKWRGGSLVDGVVDGKDVFGVLMRRWNG